MSFKNFYDLFLHELQDIYNAETQIAEALPHIAKAATSEELREALTKHAKETREQVKRLERVFSLLKEQPENRACAAMDGLLKEASEITRQQKDSVIKDAAIIAACQKVEHYEISSYGTAKAHAKLLDFSEIEDLLCDSLDEEGAANKKLTSLAEGSFFTSGINKQALETHITSRRKA